MGFVEHGRDADELLRSVGFGAVAQMPNRLFSVSEFNVITLAIQDALEDEMLGFMPLAMPKGSMAFLNRSLTQLPTLDLAFRHLNDFFGLFNQQQKVFSIKDDGKTLELHLQTELQNKSPYYIQRMLLGTYKQLSWLAKAKIDLKEVAFNFSIDDVRSEFQYVFGCENIIESDRCYITFEEDFLAKPIVQATEGADVFSEYVNFYTLLWPNLEAIDLKIRMLIGPDISKGFPSIASLAERLEVSPQTLSRWLNDHGTNYQAIKDDIRRDAAVSLLRNNKISVKEIAFKVGFQESSAFSKAFKHWFGMAPSTYREEVLGVKANS